MKEISMNGYIYLVDGDGRFNTYYRMGKDPNDERWQEELKEIEMISIDEEEKPKKKKNKK